MANIDIVSAEEIADSLGFVRLIMKNVKLVNVLRLNDKRGKTGLLTHFLSKFRVSRVTSEKSRRESHFGVKGSSC